MGGEGGGDFRSNSDGNSPGMQEAMHQSAMDAKYSFRPTRTLTHSDASQCGWERACLTVPSFSPFVSAAEYQRREIPLKVLRMLTGRGAGREPDLAPLVSLQRILYDEERAAFHLALTDSARSAGEWERSGQVAERKRDVG